VDGLNSADMKILLLSDSHGCAETIYKIAMEEKPQAILHMGDGQGAFEKLSERLLSELPYCELHNVLGNCDFNDRITPTNKLVVLGDKRFYMIHGHLFPEIKIFGDYRNAVAFAKKQRADFLVCGHTHRQKNEKIDNINVINPGAAMLDRYAVLNLRSDGDYEIKQV
jgi:putative phosphoesterase